MFSSNFIDGNAPVEEPFLLRKEIAFSKDDPMGPFLNIIDSKAHVLTNDVSRYQEAYWLYYLSLKRYFTDMYYARIWDRKLKWIHREKKKYTKPQRALLRKVDKHNTYLELDFTNSILHSRILCDRTIALSRFFLRGEKLPSFTSFSEHKKFFLKNRDTLGDNNEYSAFLVDKTDWFEKSLKNIRDKYIVHAAQKHMKFFGYGTDEDLSMVLMLPQGPPGRELSAVQPVNISIRQLSRDIRSLLTWFASYATRQVEAQ